MKKFKKYKKIGKNKKLKTIILRKLKKENERKLKNLQKSKKIQNFWKKINWKEKFFKNSKKLKRKNLGIIEKIKKSKTK